MMVNSISGVRFCGTENAATAKPAGSDFLDRPGAFAKPAETKPAPASEAPKKKGSAGKKFLAALGTAVVIAAALIAGHKKDVLKVLQETDLKEAGFMKKIGHYLGEAGKWLSEKAYDPIANKITKLFSKKTQGTN